MNLWITYVNWGSGGPLPMGDGTSIPYGRRALRWYAFFNVPILGIATCASRGSDERRRTDAEAEKTPKSGLSDDWRSTASSDCCILCSLEHAAPAPSHPRD